MKKTITTIALIAIGFVALSQKSNKKLSKDTTAAPEYDTVWVLNKADISVIEDLLRQNQMKYNGQMLSFNDVYSLLGNLASRRLVVKKDNNEKPKK